MLAGYRSSRDLVGDVRPAGHYAAARRDHGGDRAAAREHQDSNAGPCRRAGRHGVPPRPVAIRHGLGLRL